MATILDAVGSSTGNTAALLTVGSNFQTGDLRIVRLTISASATFGTTPATWSRIHEQLITGSGRVGVFTRVLQSGDANATQSFSTSTQYDRLTVTLRGVDTDATLVPLTDGSSTAATAVPAPSVATGAGTLLTFHSVTRTSTAASTTWTDPPGMTRRATATPTSSTGFVGVLETEPRVSGVSGIRTATASQTGVWRATSLFVPDVPGGPGDAPPAAGHFHVLA